jgi:hypothetical protein
MRGIQMKYLVYTLCFMFALTFIGCEKGKDSDSNMKDTTTKAMEDTPEMMEEPMEMMHEDTDEGKEMMDDESD